MESLSPIGNPYLAIFSRNHKKTHQALLDGPDTDTQFINDDTNGEKRAMLK
ncbi:hypothetical protein JHU04_000805 [Brenneria sp. 4F2]|nr:hypothetical protein [Brenneria bubanii]